MRSLAAIPVLLLACGASEPEPTPTDDGAGPLAEAAGCELLRQALLDKNPGQEVEMTCTAVWTEGEEGQVEGEATVTTKVDCDGLDPAVVRDAREADASGDLAHATELRAKVLDACGAIKTQMLLSGPQTLTVTAPVEWHADGWKVREDRLTVRVKR